MQGIPKKQLVLLACMAVSAGCIIVSNIVTNKQTELFGVALTCATFVIPFTYIASDLVAEVWGFRVARFVSLMTFSVGFMAVLVFSATIAVPGVESFSMQPAFEQLLGAVPRTMSASFASFIIGSLVNAWVMQRMHERDGERRLGLRCVLSTVAGESIDMGIFTVAAFWGVLPAPVLVETFLSGVVLKSLWETIVYAVATRHVISAVKAMPDE